MVVYCAQVVGWKFRAIPVVIENVIVIKQHSHILECKAAAQTKEIQIKVSQRPIARNNRGAVWVKSTLQDLIKDTIAVKVDLIGKKNFCGCVVVSAKIRSPKVDPIITKSDINTQNLAPGYISGTADICPLFREIITATVAPKIMGFNIALSFTARKKYSGLWSSHSH